MDNVDLPKRCEENPQTYAAFHIREHRHDRIFSTENGEEFLDAAFLLSRYLQQDAAEGRKNFSQFFYNSTDITRKQFDEFCVLRMENAGQVAGAFEIDLDAGWCSALNIADGWVTFRIKDVADAVLDASKIPGTERDQQWRSFLDHLEDKQISLKTFAPLETRGIRSLRPEDLSFREEIALSGHSLEVRLELAGRDAQQEVLGSVADSIKGPDWLAIFCSYNTARQEIDSSLSLTLYRKNGAVREAYTYPLEEEEQILLKEQVEDFCRHRTGKTLNGIYAQLDLKRDSPPELTGGSQKLPMEAVSLAGEITEYDGKLYFYVPVNFDPDAVFGTHVCTDANDNWVDVYASFDWRTGQADSALTVCLICADGYEFEFSYPLTTDEKSSLLKMMDEHCLQQTGQGLEAARASLLREHETEPEIRL